MLSTCGQPGKTNTHHTQTNAVIEIPKPTSLLGFEQNTSSKQILSMRGDQYKIFLHLLVSDIFREKKKKRLKDQRC